MNDMPRSEDTWLEKICQRLWESLEVRDEVVVTKDSRGNVKTTKKTVRPSPDDIRLVLECGLRKPLEGFEIQRRRAITDKLNYQLSIGQIDYFDALCICEIEDVPVPRFWKLREIARITLKKNENLITTAQAIEDATIADLPIPQHWLVEAALETVALEKNSNNVDIPVVINFVTTPKKETTPDASKAENAPEASQSN